MSYSHRKKFMESKESAKHNRTPTQQLKHPHSHIIQKCTWMSFIWTEDKYILVRNSGMLWIFSIDISENILHTYKSISFISYCEYTYIRHHRYQIKKTSAHWFIFNSLNSILAFSISTHPHISTVFDIQYAKILFKASDYGETKSIKVCFIQE